MAQDVASLLRIIESDSKSQFRAYASLVISLEKQFIFFFGFMRTENANISLMASAAPMKTGKFFTIIL